MNGQAPAGTRPKASDGANTITPRATATAVTAWVSSACLTIRFHTALETADIRASTNAAAGITRSRRTPTSVAVLRN